MYSVNLDIGAEKQKPGSKDNVGTANALHVVENKDFDRVVAPSEKVSGSYLRYLKPILEKSHKDDVDAFLEELLGEEE